VLKWASASIPQVFIVWCLIHTPSLTQYKTCSNNRQIYNIQLPFNAFPRNRRCNRTHQTIHHCKKHTPFHTFWPIPLAFHLTICILKDIKTSTTKADAVHSSKTSANSYQTTWCLFIYGLFNDTFNTSLYMALNDRMINERWTRNNEGNIHCIIWGTIPTFAWRGRG
jgi:hypothetical protein